MDCVGIIWRLSWKPCSGDSEEVTGRQGNIDGAAAMIVGRSLDGGNVALDTSIVIY
jgi:hypothetical protein